jgi:hypothetical protein
MIRWLANRQLNAFDCSFGCDTSYARDIFEASRWYAVLSHGES